MGQGAHTADPFDYASCLTEEIRIQSDPTRKLSLLFALYRTIETAPSRREEADALVEEMYRISPDNPDVVWETWRASWRKGPKERLAAVSALTALLEYPQDILHAHLFAAELWSEQLEAPERARKELEALRKIAADRKEVLLASARVRAFSEKLRLNTLEDLERFAELAMDAPLKAGLLFEIAVLKYRLGAPPETVSDLLSRSVALDVRDWTLLDGIRRVADKIEDWQTSEKAVRAIAESAMESEPLLAEDKPLGHTFQGLERGDDAAGAWYWFLAQIRERRLKDLPGALAALDRAQAMLPKNRMLKLERARLLSAVGNHDEALAAIPEDSSFCELAVFALSAGKKDEASYLASLERESNHSLFAEVLAESLCDTVAAPPLEAPSSVLQYWFDSRPNHGEATAVAAALKTSISPTAAAALFLEENDTAKLPPGHAIQMNNPEPWTHALNAIMGADDTRVEAFEKWAETTTDPILRQTLQGTAARLNPARAAARRISEVPPVDEPSFLDTDTGEGGPRARLAALTAEAETETDADRLRANRFKRALILLSDLDDIEAASALLETMESERADDLISTLLLLHIACLKRDIRTAADKIDRILATAPEDAPLLLLSAGEYRLLSGTDLEAALRCFDAAEEGLERTAATARVLRLTALHLLREEASIARALEDAAGSSKNEFEELLSFDNPTDGGFEAAALLEGAEDLPVCTALSNAVSALGGSEPDHIRVSAAAENLRVLAGILPEEEHPTAFFVAAALLHGFPATPAGSVDGLAEADKILYQNFEALPEASKEALEYLSASAERARGTDLYMWVDRMLTLADTAAEVNGPDAALDIIHEALAEAPDHPGLLEAEVRFALTAYAYAEAADTRGRLARFYISQDEKVHQLTQAALILFDKLQDAEGASNILREAKRRNPGHAEANEVLRYILSVVGEPVEKGENASLSPCPEEDEP